MTKINFKCIVEWQMDTTTGKAQVIRSYNFATSADDRYTKKKAKPKIQKPVEIGECEL